MNLWLAISLVLVVITIYMLTIEIYSVAFKLTGLVISKIRLQVASLFTGTGYTTSESELIAKDEKRRKIAIACIYTGHIFSVAFMGLIINVAISLSIELNSVSYSNYGEWYFIVLYVTSGLFLMMLFLKIPPINRHFQRLLEKIAVGRVKRSKKSNLITIIDLHGKHATAEVTLNILPEFSKEISLKEMELTKKYSIHILSIRRDSRYIEVTKDTMFKQGDILIIYGLLNEIKDAFIYSVMTDEQHIKEDRDDTNEIILINNYGNNAFVEVTLVTVPPVLNDVTIINAKLKERYGINVVVLKRNDEYLSVTKDTIIKKGDTLTMFGPYRNIKVLFKNETEE